jgi:hypothetical protein
MIEGKRRNTEPRGRRAGHESSRPSRANERSVERPGAADDVARRAYELYEERGREHGHDWDDWFRAEQEVSARSSQRATNEG